MQFIKFGIERMSANVVNSCQRWMKMEDYFYQLFHVKNEAKRRLNLPQASKAEAENPVNFTISRRNPVPITLLAKAATI